MASMGMRCPVDVRLSSQPTFHYNARSRRAVSIVSGHLLHPRHLHHHHHPNDLQNNIAVLGLATEKKIALQKSLHLVNSNKADDKAVPLHEKVDEWMKDSVVDIVRNLREAPLLLHLYPAHHQLDKAVEQDDWVAQSGKWANKEEPLPDGVIFVEQLPPKDDAPASGMEWGIVVQGRGHDCGPVCYLLKTNTCPGGMGLGCTHFCLIRVRNFWETARSQLTNCWLLSRSTVSPAINDINNKRGGE